MGFSKMLALLQIKEGKISSKEAKKYLAGHLGYIQIANVKNLTEKLFYIEEEEKGTVLFSKHK